MLGIIGLVIGGIWVAAAAVNSNRRISTTITGINGILKSLAQLYQGQELPGPTTNLTPMINAAGVMPSDWISGANTGTSPLGVIELMKLDSTNIVYFNMYKVPARDCMKLIFGLTGEVNSDGYGKQGLAYTTVYGSTMRTVYPYRVVAPGGGVQAYMTELKTACTGGSPATVDMMIFYIFPF